MRRCRGENSNYSEGLCKQRGLHLSESKNQCVLHKQALPAWSSAEAIQAKTRVFLCLRRVPLCRVCPVWAAA